MRLKLISYRSLLAITALQCGCSFASQDRPPLPSAGDLLGRAGLPTDFWQADVSYVGEEGAVEHWVVGSFSHPMVVEGACVADGETWELGTTKGSKDKATVLNSEPDRIAHLLSISDPECAKMPLHDYFSVDPQLSINQVKSILNKLIASSKCFKNGQIDCEHWSHVNVPAGLIGQYFQRLPKLEVSSVRRTDKGGIEIMFRASADVPATLSCIVQLENDGAQTLDVGAGPIEKS